ncbi:hypothetical protein Tco_0858339 [Tanacetum coccineum]|uniref:Uncharacterized protein n=1 Tax=Tanacetum coccineum TaxID=301880 RepID=A0ABQ5BB08_9ASTR
MIEEILCVLGRSDDKNQESERVEEIIRAQKEQGEEKQDSTYSSEILPTTTYTSSYRSMIADEDAMDKKFADRSTKKKNDSATSGSAQPPPKDDDQSSKKPRKSDASASKQHPALTSTGWQIIDTRDAGVDSSMHRSDPESEHSEQSLDDIPMQDEGNNSDMEDTDNAHIPKVLTTMWFKPIPESERPATPELEWTIPLNNFPEPENKWANTYATTYKTNMKEEALQAIYKVQLSTLLKSSEEQRGPQDRYYSTTNSFINKVLDYLLTGDKEQKKCHYPYPSLQSRLVYLDFWPRRISSIFVGESEREYDIQCGLWHHSRWFRRKEFYINKHSEPSDREAVRSRMRILSVISVKVFEKYGYNYLREIILRRADYQEYKISEKDFKNLHPNDFEDLFLLNIQEKLNHLPKTDKTSLHTAVNMWIRNLVIRNRVGDLQLGIESYQTKINLERPNWDAADYYFKEDYTIVPKPRVVVYRDRNDQRKLMRLNELHKFSDGTLTRVMEKLDHMVKDFHLFEYNKGMETRKWSEDDKRRSKDFITAIEKRLQIRRIYRSLESFVGGRIRDIDYRLINRTTRTVPKDRPCILLNWSYKVGKVAVSSSLRLLEPKRTIESRAKRSSINLVRTQHPSETMVFHNEDGNPARANIKQALGYLKDGDGDGNSQHLRYQRTKVHAKEVISIHFADNLHRCINWTNPHDEQLTLIRGVIVVKAAEDTLTDVCEAIVSYERDQTDWTSFLSRGTSAPTTSGVTKAEHTLHNINTLGIESYQLGIESYQQKVNLTAPTITFPGIEEYEMFSIIYEPVHGIIYKYSKKEKRVMRHSEIHKFYDATLNRVLEGLKSYNNDIKYAYVQKDLTKDKAEYLKLFEEEIEVRLKHRRQMRRWEMYVNGRPLTPRGERPE